MTAADLERLRTVRSYGKTGFAQTIRTLIPRGAIWELWEYFEGAIQSGGTKRSWLGGVLWAFSDEAAKVEKNLLALPVESVPGLADWLLADWERVLGLPDASAPPPTSEADRQEIAHAKYTAKYDGMAASFYIALAASYGSVIQVVEAPGGGPFRVDQNRVDRTPEDGVNGARLNSALGSPNYWRIDIGATDPNKARLTVLFQRYKPAHTILLFKEV